MRAKHKEQCRVAAERLVKVACLWGWRVKVFYAAVSGSVYVKLRHPQRRGFDLRVSDHPSHNSRYVCALHQWDLLLPIDRHLFGELERFFRFGLVGNTMRWKMGVTSKCFRFARDGVFSVGMVLRAFMAGRRGAVRPWPASDGLWLLL